MSSNIRKRILDDDSFFGSGSDDSSVGQQCPSSKKKITVEEKVNDQTIIDNMKESMQKGKKKDYEQSHHFSHKITLGKSIQTWREKRKRLGPSATFSPNQMKQNLSTLAIFNDYEVNNKQDTPVSYRAIHVDLTPKRSKLRKENPDNDAVLEFEPRSSPDNEDEHTHMTCYGTLSYPSSTPVVTTSSMPSFVGNKSYKISTNSKHSSLSKLDNSPQNVDCIAIYDELLGYYRLEMVDVRISNLSECSE